MNRLLRELGKTGLWVSPLGLGTVKFGRNQGVKYPEQFVIPDDNRLRNLLSLAKDIGINLIDTAPAYGSSEERLGILLKHQRQDWIISTKTGEEFTAGQSHFDFSKRYTRRSIERSLKRLKTDYIDIVLIHSNGDDMKIIQETDVIATLQELKTAGLIRAFGMSTKTTAGGILAADLTDIVMVTYNPDYQEEKPVIAHATQLQKGVLIKKALSSGHLSSSYSLNQRFEFIFKEPCISSAIIGTINPAHLKENADALRICLSVK